MTPTINSRMNLIDLQQDTISEEKSEEFLQTQGS
jgi:hypothetical protein